MAPSDKLLAEWFWTDRWMGSSGFLLPLEPRGLYREMLTQAWRRGARLPNDHESIRRATGTTAKEWARCWPVVSEYWRVDGDSLVNDTQADVYASARARYERESERGRKAGRVSAQVRHVLNTRSTHVQHVSNPPSPSPVKNKDIGSEKEPPTAEKIAENKKIHGFIKRFCELYSQHRHGARYLVTGNKDVPNVRRLLVTYERPRLEKLAKVLLTTDDEWVSSTDRGIGILAVKAAWLDGLLAEYEAKHGKIGAA
jgi:uncharacterized protein YdaU (DUF1376 family)